LKKASTSDKNLKQNLLIRALVFEEQAVITHGLKLKMKKVEKMLIGLENNEGKFSPDIFHCCALSEII
jgi:hypothetical protein